MKKSIDELELPLHLINGTKEYWEEQNNQSLDSITDLKHTISLMRRFLEKNTKKVIQVTNKNVVPYYETFHNTFKDAIISNGLEYNTFKKWERPFESSGFVFKEYSKEDII